MSAIVHRSASDKLAVVHSSYLFEAESYSGQREGKSVWQGFQYKSKICELVFANSPSVYIYTVKGTLQLHLRLRVSFGPYLSKQLLHRMSLRKAKEYGSMTAQ